MDQTEPSVRDKLHTAMRTLAGSTGPLKTRLRAALSADLVGLGPADFPWTDLGDRWTAVLDELAPSRRPIITLEQWWDFELVRIAEEIVDIYGEVTRRSAAG